MASANGSRVRHLPRPVLLILQRGAGERTYALFATMRGDSCFAAGKKVRRPIPAAFSTAGRAVLTALSPARDLRRTRRQNGGKRRGRPERASRFRRYAPIFSTLRKAS